MTLVPSAAKHPKKALPSGPRPREKASLTNQKRKKEFNQKDNQAKNYGKI
jgi:hypothetical protein